MLVNKDAIWFYVDENHELSFYIYMIKHNDEFFLDLRNKKIIKYKEIYYSKGVSTFLGEIANVSENSIHGVVVTEPLYRGDYNCVFNPNKDRLSLSNEAKKTLFHFKNLPISLKKLIKLQRENKTMFEKEEKERQEKKKLAQKKWSDKIIEDIKLNN